MDDTYVILAQRRANGEYLTASARVMHWHWITGRTSSERGQLSLPLA